MIFCVSCTVCVFVMPFLFVFGRHSLSFIHMWYNISIKDKKKVVL
ncbi:ferredoxin [Thermoanaerobacterium thermosaccharolyticum]|uniref:Ferredoxin n=1 Tax=Thermoanaerobacterium thermosaccharolyticum TaxID=1517 RepID=A0A223HZD5_THETR|nr:ferredoxin [Thermoanaerobacterium thermosaccharolyticum]